MYGVKGTPLQKLRLILVRWLSYAEENVKFRTMLELVVLKTEVSPELAGGMQEKAQANQATVSFFADLIRQGIEAGEICPEVHPEVAAIAALGLVNGITYFWLVDPVAFTLRGTAEESVEIFLRGIAYV